MQELITDRIQKLQPLAEEMSRLDENDEDQLLEMMDLCTRINMSAETIASTAKLLRQHLGDVHKGESA